MTSRDEEIDAILADVFKNDVEPRKPEGDMLTSIVLLTVGIIHATGWVCRLLVRIPVWASILVIVAVTVAAASIGTRGDQMVQAGVTKQDTMLEAGATPFPFDSVIHFVTEGEDLTLIATKYPECDTTASDIMKANSIIRDIDLVPVGVTLWICQKSPQ